MNSSFVSILSDRAESTPNRVVYRYVGATEGPTSLTCGELARRAATIGAQLQTRGQRGDRVLLLYPPGLEFIEAFFGCMVAGMIAVPAPPPNPLKPRRSLERLATIVESSKPSLGMTLTGVLEVLRPELPAVPAFADVGWVCTDEDMPVPDGFEPADVTEDDIALIQYTSGSTSDPKGAALSQGAVLHNMRYLDHGWDHDEDSVLVNWLPSFHDLGLVYGILTPLWGGFLAIQMSPIDVIQRPLVWLQAISRAHATHTAGPNFIYDLCVRKVSQMDAMGLDLSHLRMALTAAEPVRAETIEAFTRHFAVSGFSAKALCPGYGLSEGTCKVSAVTSTDPTVILRVSAAELERGRVQQVQEGGRRIVGCGRPGLGVGIEIVDPEQETRKGPDEVGEIWVSGPGIAQRYWHRPRVTEERLRARLAGEPGVSFLRTGDLGFMHDGELFITGRIKDIIIVRGTNHYPQDIEYTVQDAHPSVRAGCTAAFSFEADGEERLGVVAEVERRKVGAWRPDVDRRSQDPEPRLPPAQVGFSASEVVAAITGAVAQEHGLRAHRVVLIRAGTIPKTTSGKIRRRATRDAMLAGRLQRIDVGSAPAPASPAEVARGRVRDQIMDLICDTCGIAREELKPNESLHTLGVDSLSGVNIAYEIGLLLDRDVPANLITERDTVEKLVDYVVSAEDK